MHRSFHVSLRVSLGFLVLLVVLGTLAESLLLVRHPSQAAGVSHRLSPAASPTYKSTILGDHPTVYYRLDESSGPTANDSSGNGYNATYASTGITYGVGGALSGDTDTAITTSSSGAAVTAPDSTLPQGATPRTLEMWVNTTSAPNGFMTYASYGTNAANQLFALDQVYGNVVAFETGNGVSTRFTAPYSIADGNWHQIAVTYDGGTALLIYFDGQLMTGMTLSAALATSAGGSQGLKIGAGPSGTYAGSLDEVAIYPSALSAGRINTHWQSGLALSCPPAPSSGYAGTISGDSPVRYYRLGEISGRGALDSSPNCQAGVYRPDTGHTSGAIIGDPDGAASRPSGGGLFVNANPTGLAVGSAPRTIELWENTTSAPNGFMDYVSYGTNAPGQMFSVDQVYGSQLDLNYGSGTTLRFNTPYGISDGRWHQVAFTYDSGTTIAFYLDGQQIGTMALASPLNTTIGGQGLEIGSGPSGSYTGSLDEVALYNTALTPAKLNAHFRAGSGVTSCASKPSSGYDGAVVADSPTRYWRLAETGGRYAVDSSGHCQYAAYNGNTTHGPGPIVTESGGGGGAGAPSDGGAYATASATGLPLGSAARSVELWISDTQAPNGMLSYFAYGTDTTGNLFGVNQVYGNMLSFDEGGANGPRFTAPYMIADGNWHQVVLTYDGTTTVTMYLDGASIGSGTLSSALNTIVAGQGVQIGGGPRDHFAGTIGEVSIYPSALSSTQVLNHYLASAPKGGSYDGSQAYGGGNFCIPCALANAHQAHGFPVDTATGNMWDSWTDFDIEGRGYPLQFSRTYNSAAAGTNGPLGYGWQASLGMSLDQSGNSVTITQENASTVSFSLSGSTWSPAAPRYIATLTHNGDGTWTFVRQARDTYTFNSSGQLVAATDLNGYVTTYSYSGGVLTGITKDARSGGRSLTIGYSGGHITSITDANVSPNRVTQYQYNDGAGNLTDVIDVNGGHWQFVYDANHRMTTMKDPKCFATSSCPGVVTDYNSSGQVDWQQDQLGRQTNYDYGSIANATKVTDPKGNVEVDYYSQGLLVAQTKGYGTSAAATWQFSYDPNTLARTSVTDPNGHTTSYRYDANGNLTKVIDPLGHATTRTYNSLNEVLTDQDPNLVTTHNTYDVHGNLTRISRPLAGTSQTQTIIYNYADSAHPGDITSMVDADGKTWTYGYDAYGDRSSTKDPIGNQSTSAFNADGWLTSSVSPRGNVAGCGCQSAYTTIYGHNAFGNVTTVTDPLGHMTIWHYDLDQNLDTFTDADGNRTTYVYDLANERIQVKRADTPQTTLTTDYNADGTVLDQKDGKNNAILTYGYDSLARVTSTTDALGNVTSYTYDAAGNRLTKQDPGGSCSATPKTGCTSFAYDADNELTGITYSDGVTPNVSNITYDSDGQRTSMTDGTGTSRWSWDSLHRITSYTDGHGNQVRYAYNLRNLLTTITYPGGTQTVTRAYDDAGRWTSVTDWNSNMTNFGYDPDSNLTTETLPTATGVVDSFGFDHADRLTSISDAKGGTSFFSAAYSRDKANQLTSDSSAPSSRSAYKYTALNQVCYAGSSSSSACTSPPSGSLAYAYDAADNLIQTGRTQQMFNAADELCWTLSGSKSSNPCGTMPAGATAYSYDTRGNRTRVTPASGSPTALDYDQANRLTSWVKGTTTVIFAYNGDGLRMSKTAGTTSQFTWDVSGSLPLLLKGGTTAYVYGPGGLPLEQVSGTTVNYFHHDQLGSTRAVTDSTGTVVQSYTYDPYGNIASSSGTAAVPFRYTGQYLDAETGLYYLRARYYDPSTGQFISQDPLVATMRQPYEYAGDHPVNTSDPTGLWGTALQLGGEAECLLGPLCQGGQYVTGCAVGIGLFGRGAPGDNNAAFGSYLSYPDDKHPQGFGVYGGGGYSFMLTNGSTDPSDPQSIYGAGTTTEANASLVLVGASATLTTSANGTWMFTLSVKPLASVGAGLDFAKYQSQTVPGAIGTALNNLTHWPL